MNRARISTVTVLLLFSFAVPAACRAGSGGRFVLPTGRRLAKCPYVVTIDMTWSDVHGYRPLRVEVARNARTPLNVERDVYVELQPFMWSYQRSRDTIGQNVTLPEGKRSVETTFYLPQDRIVNGLRLSVSEDGRPIKGLWEQDCSLSRNTNPEYRESEPSILVIDYDAPEFSTRSSALARLRSVSESGEVMSHTLPDLRQVVNILPNGNQYGGVKKSADDLRVLELLKDWSRVELVNPNEVPDIWLGISGADIVFVSWGDLQRMKVDHQKSFDSLFRWLLSGGNLAVYGLGAEFANLAELEVHLGLMPSSTAAISDGGETDDPSSEQVRDTTRTDAHGDRHWRKPDEDRYGRSMRIFHDARNEIRQSYGVVESDMEAQLTVNPSPRSNRQGKRNVPAAPFVYRNAQLGTLIAWEAENPFPGEIETWNWFFNTLGSNRVLWYRRHGLSFRQENNDFWNFLIPGVGMAPVNAFRLLITIFVVVIGPVNFLVLRRFKRLNWILVTVPMGASLVTLGLLTFALVTDGLGVQYRVRGFTHIDQQQRHATSWARQSYYAGLAPSGGFNFPLDTAVYPLEQFPATEYGRQPARRRVEWDTQQHLTTGYIVPRVSSQFVVVRSNPTRRNLELKERENGEPLQVVNHLGTRILQLYVCDEAGQIHVAKNVDEGADAGLSPTDVETSGKELVKLFQSVRLSRPPGFDEQSFNNVVNMNTMYYYGSASGDSGLPPASQRSSILERRLAMIRRNGAAALGPGSYIAVVEESPEIPLGVKKGIPRECLTLITGNY